MKTARVLAVAVVAQTVALIVMAARVRAANRHVRIAFKMVAAAAWRDAWITDVLGGEPTVEITEIEYSKN